MRPLHTRAPPHTAACARRPNSPTAAAPVNQGLHSRQHALIAPQQPRAAAPDATHPTSPSAPVRAARRRPSALRAALLAVMSDQQHAAAAQRVCPRTGKRARSALRCWGAPASPYLPPRCATGPQQCSTARPHAGRCAAPPAPPHHVPDRDLRSQDLARRERHRPRPALLAALTTSTLQRARRNRPHARHLSHAARALSRVRPLGTALLGVVHPPCSTAAHPHVHALSAAHLAHCTHLPLPPIHQPRVLPAAARALARARARRRARSACCTAVRHASTAPQQVHMPHSYTLRVCMAGRLAVVCLCLMICVLYT